jgi:hypothetical protein
MKKNPSIETTWRRLGLCVSGLSVAAFLTCAKAQIQTAGTLFINLDATTLSGANGTAVNDITNAGSLGGYFEGTGIYLTNSAGVVGLGFPGGSSGTSGYMQLKASIAGALIPPALGMVGPQATYSVEAWVLNPQVTGDESMIAWGARSTGLNAAFEYGTGSSGGFQHNGGGNDIQWDPLPSGGGGAPLNGYWHHLAYTCDGATQRLYADGVLVNSQTIGNYSTATNAGVALGAQWTSTGNAIATSPNYATLILGRVRVHNDVLTPAQILNNYNYEKSAFITPVTPAFLTAGPVHRYSFSEPATNDATGLTVHDSIGGADGTVQASYSNSLPQFTGSRLVLPGGVQTQIPEYGAPFVALPSGLVSGNSAVLGGSGQVSIEVWYQNNSPAYSWCRVFDAGSCGNLAGQLGQQVTGAGNYPPGYVSTGYGYLDTFAFATQNGGNANQHQLLWQNRDQLPMFGGNYTATNSAQVNANIQTLGSVGAERHLVVTWDESTGQLAAYENGVQVASMTALTNMLALNDVNVWLGRSMSGTDGGLDGEFDEVRFYNYVLSPGQVLGDFQTGPDTINTAAQAASILTQPLSQTVNQGWPVTFYLEASGSPALSYQWNRNGTALPGATAASYTLSAAGSDNNNDQYSCVVSNNTGSPNVVTSATAILTVTPNAAPPFVVLHETKDANPSVAVGSQRDNYDGTVGASFKVGANGAIVTHLGMYDVFGDYPGTDLNQALWPAGLQRDHLISLYSGDGSTLIASADIPAGTGGFLYHNYRYAALSTPIFLAGNSNYLIQADVYNADGDMWGDVSATTSWAPYFVGTNAPTTRGARYGSHGSAVNGNSTVNGIYYAPNLAAFPVGAPVISAIQTGVTQYVNLSATLSVAADGQAPMTLQWYKVGPPDTLLAGQTSSSLNFASLATTDQGNYYALVTNPLGTAQSANIFLRVFTDTAVSITQPPTNITVLQGYSATFYLGASGTPPLGYQWLRNSNPIAGATTSIYTLAVADSTNNGDLYSCVVSNFANGSPQTLTSTAATLTVTPNQAPVPEALYAATSGTRDNYNGSVGAIFQVGATPAVVTHLGFFCQNGSLAGVHEVTLFSGDGSTVLGDVSISGSGDLLLNQYAWVALTNPVTLAANASYVIAANVFSGDGDPWPDVFAPSPWNSYYVGATPGTTRMALYGGYLPTPPTGASSPNSIYGAPNLALLPVGAPVVVLQQTNVSAYVGSNVTVSAFVNGQPPLTVQWYKSPSTLLSGQTSATLTLSNLALSDQGSYYLVANNPQGPTTSGSVNLTVLAAGPPVITQSPQSQTIYLNQTASFSVDVPVPPQSYQWRFNGANLAQGTSSALVVPNVTTANVGNYDVVVANSFGANTSAVAVLTVLVPPAGSYEAAVFNADPLVYYRFNDSAATNSFNFGSLGVAAAGTYEGSYAIGPGPQPPSFPNFEPTNQALVLDGQSVDVAIPALNLDTSTGPDMTLAAWINSPGPQQSYAGILFCRGTGGASGFGIRSDPTTSNDELEYHWGGNYYGFNTALYVTNFGAWEFAALVVYPDQAILYLNNGTGLQSVTNVATHTAVPFSATTYVGWDDNDAPAITNSRRFAGSIDEPMIFNRSLTADEINALYHAGIGPVRLQVSNQPGNVVLSWSAGVLQQAAQVGGPYQDVSAASPYTNSLSGSQSYFRVRVP